MHNIQYKDLVYMYTCSYLHEHGVMPTSLIYSNTPATMYLICCLLFLILFSAFPGMDGFMLDNYISHWCSLLGLYILCAIIDEV